MTTISDSALAVAYLQACRVDVAAIKPGNVWFGAPAYGMQAQDFIDSAEHSVYPLVDARLSLGERIERAVSATHGSVGTNTNLGIVLLCAPLIMAAQQEPHVPLAEGVERVLARSSVDDAVAAYRAIRLANPGGMGESEEHDLADTPRVSLREAMDSAADRDLIARQYRDGYALLFEELLPYLKQRLEEGESYEMAASLLFLWLLSRHTDSHIWRKHGRAAAESASRLAGGCLFVCRLTRAVGDITQHLRHLDRRFKRASLNPGTSADLCVATFLSYRLQQQMAHKTGVDPEPHRVSKPGSVRMTHFSISQSFEGDMQWL
jgi:triphosphoribosyl-dephospho-CoA synthase